MGGVVYCTVWREREEERREGGVEGGRDREEREREEREREGEEEEGQILPLPFP